MMVVLHLRPSCASDSMTIKCVGYNICTTPNVIVDVKASRLTTLC